MSDYASALNASDSGFLNSLHDAHQFRSPRRGVDSRIGGDPCSAADAPDMETMLRQVPLPDGLQERLKQSMRES